MDSLGYIIVVNQLCISFYGLTWSYHHRDSIGHIITQTYLVLSSKELTWSYHWIDPLGNIIRWTHLVISLEGLTLSYSRMDSLGHIIVCVIKARISCEKWTTCPYMSLKVKKKKKKTLVSLLTHLKPQCLSFNTVEFPSTLVHLVIVEHCIFVYYNSLQNFTSQ